MNKFTRYFWGVFFFYFIFIHGAIIYYSIGTEPVSGSDDATNSYIALYLCIALWVFIFGGFLYWIYKRTFVSQKNIQEILRKGVRLDGKILESKIMKSSNKSMEKRELTLSLQNIKGESILHKMEIFDSKPHQHRFEEGNSISIRVDPSFTKIPFWIMSDTQTKINYRLFVIWGLSLIAIISYFALVYYLESNGQGWRFFVFWHPLMISAVSICFFGGIFYLIITKLLGKFKGKQGTKLKFTGRKTMAKILNIAQTGTYINNQPQVKFNLEYTDHLGRTHLNEIKKIVSLLEVGNLNQQTEKEIFFLEEDPTEIAFAEDLI